MPWKLKSESDTEKVYAQVSSGVETGQYRYCFDDGRTLEVGADGLHGPGTPAKRPHRLRSALLAAVPVAAFLGDLAWHALR